MAKDNGNGTVTIEKGDSLWAIAEKYGSQIEGSTTWAKVQTIAKLNNMATTDVIRVGDVLHL